MRTVDCVCGGTITAPSLAQSGPYVEAHGWTGQHRLWRAAKECWVRLPYLDPRYRVPRRSTAGTSLVTCPSSPGASTVGGAG